MENSKFYLVKVRETFIADNGKNQKVVRQYLMQDVCTAGAETGARLLYNDSTIDWEIISVAETKIDEVHLTTKAND